ncbi:MAG: glycosyltransferase [Verrucomicrobia bacterium]|nr:MAG: glycosyltransferase [Verrucomicrobiota bacterium]
MIRFVYNLFWPIGLLFFLPGYLLKMVRRGGYRKKFGQRLGIYDRDLRARLSRSNEKGSTWLHAVSVGEVMIALKLVQQLRTLEPDVHCVLTTTTTTGFALANKNALRRIEVMYTPLDFWPVMRRAFSVIRPTRIVLVEAEIWPNLAAEAHARRIPLVLVNARLSPRSERRFRQFQFLVAPTFRLLDLVCVQEPEDVDRWHRLGVERSRIKYTGSIKYDPADFDYTAEAQGPGGVVATSPGYVLPVLSLERPVLFGGSTHRGEEEILTRAFLNLRQKFPSLCLFIAPRHVERVQQIRAQLEALSLDVRVASRVAGDNETKADCVLLDRTGELQRWYSIATVVFIGKSLTAHGGQNPVEPILAGKPVIFGPHMENFATLARTLVSKNGAIQVSDIDSLERAVDNLLRDSETRQRLVQSAREVLNQHRGATARAAALIADLRSGRKAAKE